MRLPRRPRHTTATTTRRRRLPRPPAPPRRGVRAGAAGLLGRADASLLDVLDNVLTKGVAIEGDVVLGLAGVDLVYLRLSALLCAADRLAGGRR